MLRLLVFLLAISGALSFTIRGFNGRLRLQRAQYESGVRLQDIDTWMRGMVNGDTNFDDDDELPGNGFRLSLMEKMKRKATATLKLKEPGSLILVRHGQTAMNYNKTFTGWIDTDLSETGEQEMLYAARLLLERGYDVDVTYTSRLKRAIRSSWIMYQEMESVFRPVYKSWRLNERMYGTLEGMSKPGSADIFGEEIIQSYRTGLKARPPPMTPDHPNWHFNERKYADLNAMEIPVTESLQDTMERTLPLFQDRILPDLMSGNTVMIMAHANSIRGIVKHLDNLTGEEIRQVSIPNGIPLVYKFDRGLKPIRMPNSVAPLFGEFLEQKGRLKAALKREEELAASIPGYQSIETQSKRASVSSDARVRGLSLLNEQRRRFKETPSSPLVTVATTTTRTRSTSSKEEEEKKGEEKGDEEEEKDCLVVDKDGNCLVEEAGVIRVKRTQQAQETQEELALELAQDKKEEDKDSKLLGEDEKQFLLSMSNSQTLEEPFVVIIRHGKTEYNKLGIFTGWEDAPLAAEGRVEATAAGKLLKKHGIQFDIVYTSWLSRAIETAWIVMDELDSLWLPLVKTWRLNERMYGALTGLSKKMIKEKHGDAQFMKWRRGYDIRPPDISSFSANYPGNDDRYARYATDVRPSFVESLIRSVSHRRLQLHRKFPKTESLQDCMRRTIPFFTGTIVPKSINKGKTVLIASSENAIRGLLMHLCDIPQDRISEVEIPTGLPLVYCFKNKNIRLLEDGTEDPYNPLGRYNFGTSPELLFNPCPTEEDEVRDEELRGDLLDPTFDPNGGSECMFTSDGKTYAYDPLLRLSQAKGRVDGEKSRRLEQKRLRTKEYEKEYEQLGE